MPSYYKGARGRNDLLRDAERIRRVGRHRPSPGDPLPVTPAPTPGAPKVSAPKVVKRRPGSGAKPAKTFERMRAALLDKFGRKRCLNENRDAMALEISPGFRGPKQNPLTAQDYTFKLALGSINEETRQMLAEGKSIA